MASVLIGKGNAVGMFYVAAKGTALPSTPDTTPGAGWKKVGDVSSDGISMSLPSGDVIKNWALEAVRKINTENGKISAPIIETTQTVFETLFGASNVTVTAASASHGKISTVALDPSVSAEPAAYLFLIKDGDALISIGTTNGLITEIADVDFAPDSAVIWTPTIDANWTISVDDGETTS